MRQPDMRARLKRLYAKFAAARLLGHTAWRTAWTNPASWSKEKRELEELSGWTPEDQRMLETLVHLVREQHPKASEEAQLAEIEGKLGIGWVTAKRFASVRTAIGRVMRKEKPT